MTNHPGVKQNGDLEKIARRTMQEYGFMPDFSGEALGELETIRRGDRGMGPAEMDLRHLLWASIDNDDSLDLNQLTVAEVLTEV